MTIYSAEQLRDGAVSIFGALDFDTRTQGFSPRRLPDWTRAQLPGTMDAIVRMPSGVRLAFETESREIRLSVQTTSLTTPPQPPRPVTFDLVVKGGQTYSSASHRGNAMRLDRKDPGKFELVRGDAYEVVFGDLGPGPKSCELWLPHNSFVEIRSLTIDDGTSLSPTPPPQGWRWIHYGSSISHCMEATQPTGTWPAVTARLANLHLQSLGFGGQCMLDQFVARTIRDSDADIISMKIGINIINGDTLRERTFTPTLHGFLDTIREGKANTPIVVVSPIYCPSAETRPGPTIPDAAGKFVTLSGHEAVQAGCMTLVRIRELIAEVIQVRRDAGDANLHYVDGLGLFGPGDAHDLPDDLHPSPEGYLRMGERFARLVFAGEGLDLASRLNPPSRL